MVRRSTNARPVVDPLPIRLGGDTCPDGKPQRANVLPADALGGVEALSSNRLMTARSASQIRAADSTSMLSTVWRSKVDLLIALSTSAVAACCTTASSNSRVFVASWFASEADEVSLRLA